MNKRNRFAGLLVASIGVAGLLFWQNDLISGQRTSLEFHEKKITSLETELRRSEAISLELQHENSLLRNENKQLRDSIFWLNNHVKELQDNLQLHEKKLATIQKDLTKKERFIAFLQNKITDLNKKAALSASIAEAQNAKIEAAKPTILAAKPSQSVAPMAMLPATNSPQKQLENIKMQSEKEADVLREKAAVEALKKKETATAIENGELHLKLLASAELMAKTTDVSFTNIALRSNKTSLPLTVIAEDGKNWAVTDLKIVLSNPRPTMLSEQKFAVEIVDIDTGLAMPSLESNPAFPNSKNNTAGFLIQWRGEPIEQCYVSRVKKAGKNYDLRVYYIYDGKKIPMPHATKALVRHSKVMV
jgi:hypothetical protein